MWKPAKDLHWQKNAECAKPEYENSIEIFFSNDFSEKHEAKNVCFSCPVRSQCLQWALENKQIWGIWGGNDEFELRRALSVSYLGEEAKRKRPPKCPYCRARPQNLDVSTEDLPGGGRWSTAKVVYCKICNFSWKSRTSVNAVNAYKNSKKRQEKK